jgi:Uma2 family endonuclease
MSAVVIEDQLEIPLGIRNLRDFRKWMRSPEFPERGRIDYIDGDIEVEMSPEQFFSHSGPKTEIIRALANWNHRQLQRGYLATDSMRFVNRSAELSCEPDIIYVSYDSLKSGRVRLIPQKKDDPDRCLELEGAVDLVVEILSDSSIAKDTRRLPVAYFAAGVLEYWLVDARDDRDLVHRIYRRGKTRFQRVRPDADGFQKSGVFKQSFQLTRERSDLGLWQFQLQMR